MSARKSENPVPEPQPIRTAGEAGIQDILSLLLENTRDAIYLLAGRRFPIINRGFQEMFGVTPEEANSTDFNFMNLVAPESQPLVIERAEKYAKGEPVPHEYEFRALTKDGRKLIVLANTSRVNYLGEEATLGIVHDITARKEIEEALSASEEKYRTLVERANDGIAILHDGKLAFVNERLAKGLGYKVEEMVGSPMTDFIPPDKIGELVERYERRMAGEDVPSIYEIEIARKDGEIRHIEVNAGLITYMDQPADLIIARDVTNRKKTERELRENEAFLESVFESIQDGISILDPDLTIRRVNGIMKKWYAENLPLEGRKCYECYHNTTEVCDPCPTVRCIESGQTESDIVPGLAGSPVEWLGLYSYPIKDETTGEVTGVAEFVRDITESRRAELAILESEERFRMAFDHAHIGRGMASPDGRFTKVNRSLCDILGYTQEELLQKTWMEVTHPDDLELSTQHSIAMMQGDVPSFQLEHMLLHKEGYGVWVNLSVVLIRDQEGNPLYVLGDIENITVRKQAEEALQLSELNLRTMFETMVEGVAWIDLDGRYLKANRAAEQILRLKNSEEYPEQYLLPEWEMVREDKSEMPLEEQPVSRAMKSMQTVKNVITGLRHPDGTITWINLSVTPLLDEKGKPTGFINTFADITDQKILEQQLFQAQKMEAIGRLAGGIAHDFNNILTVISGNAQLAIMTLKEEDPMHERMKTILKSTGHAEELTRRLLAFGRKQITSPKVLDINDILHELEQMLHRVIGEDIQLIIKPGIDIGSITFDPTQMEQILVNLVVNSRDAMPDGGTLTIETTQVELGIDYIRIHPYVEPGRYMRISVIDNGTGMSEETKQHIFEPFFTTKEMGSGLGLATVYGIVKQSGGSIEVTSKEGACTTFKIYIPVVDLPSEPFSVLRVQPEMQKGIETILVVEDEEGVRVFATEILTELGYTVHDFGSPEKAWEFCESGDRSLDLILTDVIMPGASGADLVARLKNNYPETPAIFMSGHTDDFIVHHGVLDEGVEFLPKPFSPQELSSRVRKLLDLSEEH